MCYDTGLWCFQVSFYLRKKCYVLSLSQFHWQVKEEMLIEALTTRKTVTVGERLIVPYKLAEVRLLFNSTEMTHAVACLVYTMKHRGNLENSANCCPWIPTCVPCLIHPRSEP